jgi:hypothetical protein
MARVDLKTGAVKWSRSSSKSLVIIDERRVGSATDTDPNYASGLAGIEAGATWSGGGWTGTSWPIVQYRRLRVALS